MLPSIEDKLKIKGQSLNTTEDIDRFTALFNILIEINRKEMGVRGSQIPKSDNESSKGVLQTKALREHEKGNPRAKIKS